jgi:hypothetical protein
VGTRPAISPDVAGDDGDLGDGIPASTPLTFLLLQIITNVYLSRSGL